MRRVDKGQFYWWLVEKEGYEELMEVKLFLRRS